MKQGKKRRPLHHGSNFGLPVTCVKFYPFNSNFLITTGINLKTLIYHGNLHLLDIDGQIMIEMMYNSSTSK